MADRYNGDTGLFTAEEFKNRGVIKLAPDALVYINGSDVGAFIAPVSGQSQNTSFQDGVTSINIQNNVDPPGSSTAAIEISTPIYSEKSNYWMEVKDDVGGVTLKSVWTPMMEIQVYFKGRFLVGQYPRYYSAFWGFVTNVEESYSSGQYKTTLQCADMLHWWQYIQVAFRPSVESNQFTGGKSGITAYGSRYETANPYEILYSLCQDMGYENFITPSWVGKLNADKSASYPDPRYSRMFEETFKYWNERFSQSGNLLKMYGASGKLMRLNTEGGVEAVTVNPTPVPAPNSNNTSQQAVDSRVSEPVDMMDEQIKKFQVFHEFSGMKNLSEAEYKTKLEIATELKTRVGFEFFQDVNGNFIFKPPFYNLNTKPLLPYNIKPQDILSFSASVNSEEIITALEVQASPQQNFRNNNWINIIGYHIDIDKVKKYGFRYKKIDCWWLSESKVVQSYAVGELGMTNAKAYTATVTIPGRPELRLGYPVYIEHRDAFYYVRSISHAFDYGGSFTTTLSLEAERPRIRSGDSNPVIQKNKIYKYIERAVDAELQKQIGAIQADIKAQTEYNHAVAVAKQSVIDTEKTTGKKTVAELPKPPDYGKATKKLGATKTDAKGNIIEADPSVALQNLLKQLGGTASLPKGLYDIVTSTDPREQSVTHDTIPYTDEEGYQVIGAFRYGRGILVKAGSAVKADEISLDQQFDPNLLVESRQASEVATMKTEATAEGDSQAAYFAANAQASIEGAQVPFFKFEAAREAGGNIDRGSPGKILADMQEMSKIIRDMSAGNREPAPDGKKVQPSNSK